MNHAEYMVNFIVANSRLEDMYHTNEEIMRIRDVVIGKNSTQAIDEIIFLHMKKYGRHLVEESDEYPFLQG